MNAAARIYFWDVNVGMYRCIVPRVLGVGGNANSFVYRPSKFNVIVCNIARGHFQVNFYFRYGAFIFLIEISYFTPT